MAFEVPYWPEGLDEALDPLGAPRPPYAGVLAAAAAAGLPELEARATAVARAGEIDFGPAERTVVLDPLPRLIDAEEWAVLSAGLRQRALALNAFVRDIYGDAAIVDSGRVPRRVVTSADHFEPSLAGVDPGEAPVPIIGFDLVRGGDGRLRVLEDNTRTPSGIAYAAVIRRALAEVFPPGRSASLADPESAYAALGVALDAGSGGRRVLLSDGETNIAWFEHCEIAGRLQIPVTTPDALRVRDDRLVAELDEGPAEISLVYRRTDEDRLRDEGGEPTWLDVLLAGPVRAGRLRVANALGGGVADDKLVHAYVEDMIRFYLLEEPLVGSVRTFDLGDEGVREEALGRLNQLVVKPRAGLGGEGVVIGSTAAAAETKRAAEEIRRSPDDFVAQEIVDLSTHPTIAHGRLEPRRVDLRAFAIGGELAPAPLTRFADSREEHVVNSSQGGGIKDTWVLTDASSGTASGASSG